MVDDAVTAEIPSTALPDDAAVLSQLAGLGLVLARALQAKA
jgi:hypothetical protein